jgi:hypothetical protein
MSWRRVLADPRCSQLKIILHALKYPINLLNLERHIRRDYILCCREKRKELLCFPLFSYVDLLLLVCYYSFGGTPKARQPLMSCPSVTLSRVRPSRSHVHTSGTKPAICLMWCLVISVTVYFPANSPKNFL